MSMEDFDARFDEGESVLPYADMSKASRPNRGKHSSGSPRKVHPGEILREEFLVPLNITPHALAVALGVPATRIADIVHERRGITADTAARLSRYFGTSAQMWLNLQNSFDLAVVREKKKADLARIQTFSLIPATA